MRKLIHAWHRQRFRVLFFSLLLTLCGEPIADSLGAPWSPFEFLLAASLLAAAMTALRDRRVMVLLVLFGVLRTIGYLFTETTAISAGAAAWIVGAGLAMFDTLARAMDRDRVDAEKLFAAVDAYLLGAIIFGVCYWRIDQAFPGSLRVTAGEPLTAFRALYFSFVTITSVGYGDIVPASDVIRGLCLAEAIGGQMYIAILIARLVSLYEADTR